MLGLPQSTEFNRRIPKQKFYENLIISPTLKRVFVEQIRVQRKRRWWRRCSASGASWLGGEEEGVEAEPLG